MGIGDYPNFLSPNERHEGSHPARPRSNAMADTAGEALKPTEFQLNPYINFEAKDVVRSLDSIETLQLIEELDEELDSWEATILLARHFAELAKNAPADLLTMSVAELEDRLDEPKEESE
jgi:hypothetical protein